MYRYIYNIYEYILLLHIDGKWIDGYIYKKEKYLYTSTNKQPVAHKLNGNFYTLYICNIIKNILHGIYIGIYYIHTPISIYIYISI